MARVVTDDKHYHDIAAKIKSYDKAWEDSGVKPAEMAGAVDDVYGVGKIDGYVEAQLDEQAIYNRGLAAGKQAEHDRFWNENQENGKRTNYAYGYLRAWTDAMFYPKYDMMPTDASFMFQYTKITDLKDKLELLGVKLDLSECTAMTQMFQGAAITHVPELNMRKVTTCGYAFGTKSRIVTIDKIISSETTVFNVSAFNQAENLQHVTFEGVIASSIDVHWSPLTKDSFVSLANVLLPTATATLTVSKAAVSAAFPNRAEWDALFINKPNWTVSEV